MYTGKIVYMYYRQTQRPSSRQPPPPSDRQKKRRPSYVYWLPRGGQLRAERWSGHQRYRQTTYRRPLETERWSGHQRQTDNPQGTTWEPKYEVATRDRQTTHRGPLESRNMKWPLRGRHTQYTVFIFHTLQILSTLTAMVLHVIRTYVHILQYYGRICIQAHKKLK